MKIRKLDDLAATIRRLRGEGKTVALCHGCFDLLHLGHIKHLQMARAVADYLCVTISPDRFVDKGPNRPFFTETLRAEALAALECVDFVGINEWPTAEETLRTLRPTYYVKGQEFAGLQDKTGKLQRELVAAEESGVALRFTHEIVYSSTKLIAQLYGANLEASSHPVTLRDAYPAPTREYLAEFASRHSLRDIASRLEGLRGLRALVLGDGIVDEYHYCSTLGRAKKSPLVVYRYQSEEVFAGGAFAIANHVANLCDEVRLVTLLGAQDSREEFVRGKLRPGVRPKFFYRADGPTVVKRRYIEQYLNQKSFEVNYLNDTHVPEEIEREIVAYVEAEAPAHDILLLSDFGHGLITPRIIAAAQRCARFLAVNAQTNAANAGHNLITKYRQPHFICLDEPEARLAAQDRFGPIREVAGRLLRETSAGSLIVTLGKSGSFGINARGEESCCPVFSTSVLDTVGAGDAYFAYTAPCVAAGMPWPMVSFVGNAVGAIAVQIVCNRKPVEKSELLDFLHHLLK